MTTIVDYSKINLKELYWDGDLSCEEIGKLFGVGGLAIRTAMGRRNIPIRSAPERTTLALQKYPFTEKTRVICSEAAKRDWEVARESRIAGMQKAIQEGRCSKGLPVGYVVSEKTRKKIRKGVTRYYKNPEARERTSQFLLRYWERHPEKKEEIRQKLLNHPVSEDTRNKIRAKRLLQIFPIKDTAPEVAMQQILAELSIVFEKHKPVLGICQTDMFIQPNICIFVDGEYWHTRPEVIKRDSHITEALTNAGYKVIRIWDYELKDIKQAQEAIKEIFG